MAFNLTTWGDYPGGDMIIPSKRNRGNSGFSLVQEVSN